MEAEEESRRLQEEIAASRIERERRRANNRRSTTAPVDYTASTAICGSTFASYQDSHSDQCCSIACR